MHRDLKPENIFVTSDGRVKILDFGLAKLKEPPASSSSETEPLPSTAPGVVLGTVGYMAPEQVLGHETDGRADIFSLGVILYEMLGGRRPFSGESGVEIMTAILKEEPAELTEVNPKVPPVLARVVRHCLEKKPEQRFQSASDLGFALDALSLASPSSPTSVKIASARTSRHLLRWLVPTLVLLIAGAALAWHLKRSDFWWRNPLTNAQFTPLTDFPGAEGEAAISRDGKFVAFLSDRDGPFDAWVGQIGTGEFKNLTEGRVPDMRNPELRSIGFSPDGALVSIWVRVMNRPTMWAVPTMGGTVRPHMDAAEREWSPDGTRMVYHPSADGDPLFVTAPNEKEGKQIYVAARGVHCHFPLWSPEGNFIYFVQGYPPNEMDIWRVRPTGGSAERITFHNSSVAFPTLLDERTLLYISKASDGSGPWLFGMDVERRVPHRISFGVERYTSIAATADGRRLVATVSNPEATLWRVPISQGIVEEGGASRVALPTVRGLSPRIGRDYMLYLSSKGGDDGVWKLANGTSVELWSGSLGRVLTGPAISPDGRLIAFTPHKGGRTRLYLMTENGTSVREVAGDLDVRGAPAWSPDGQWITVGAARGSEVRLFNIPLGGGPPVQMGDDQSVNPVWSPDGRFLVYSGVQVGTALTIRAIGADGKPHRLPELILSRGAQNRFAFLPGRPVLAVLKGEFLHKNFWLIDLTTGQQRQLTNFSRDFLISDFDISPDGKEIIFSRLKENSNVVLIDLAEQ